MKRRSSYPLWLILSASLFGAAVARGNEDDAIDRAIDKGVAYLRSQVEKDPWWERSPIRNPAQPGLKRAARKKAGARAQDRYIMGRTAIELYALLVSDVSLDDPLISKGFEYLADLEPQAVYSVALYIMALDAALGQAEADSALLGRTTVSGGSSVEARKLQGRMEEMTRWLVGARHEGRGVWNYGTAGAAGGRYDNSNTQFAVLALGVAAKRGISIPNRVWSEILKHFLDGQEKGGREVDLKVEWETGPPDDGGATRVGKPPPIRARGWGYQDGGSTLNMTAAGISSLLISRTYLSKAGEIQPEERQRISGAIMDGLARLAAYGLSYVRNHLYYGLYSVEKVGDLGGIKKIGDLDWYRHGADILLREQRADGSWGNDGAMEENNRRYQTSFALLFLCRATDLISRARPIFTRALRAEHGQGWIYLSKLQGEVSLSRFFRKLRYNTKSEMLFLAETILAEAEKQGRLPDLVPHALKLAALENPKLQRFAQKCLEKGTGEKQKDLAGYRDWLRAWRMATRAGEEKDARAVPELRKLLVETKSVPLKQQILWAFERTMARDALGELIAEMETGKTPEYRGRVHRVAKYISGQDLPFDPEASSTTRTEQIARWRKWLETEGASR